MLLFICVFCFFVGVLLFSFGLLMLSWVLSLAPVDILCIVLSHSLFLMKFVSYKKKLVQFPALSVSRVYFWKLWNIDIVLSTTGKIVFAAPSRPLVVQQIQACHNIVGISQVRTSFIYKQSFVEYLVFTRQLYLLTYCEKIMIKPIAGMDNWHDRSDKSYKKSILVEN